MAGDGMLADIRERLHKKSIHEVRLIARAVGVHSPTDGKKDFIIGKIMAIASCESEPAPRSARGAPPKSTEYDEALVADIRECIKFFAAERAGEEVGTNTYSVSDGSDTHCSGILDRDEKYAFLRINGCLPCADDVYVAETIINRFNLRRGDKIEGVCRRIQSGFTLSAITSVNGCRPDSLSRREFDSLTHIYPEKRIFIGGSSQDICARMTDLFAPFGFGQRSVISAPANFSKITLIKSITAAISSCGQAEKIIFLVGGYPEEVTDIRRSAPEAEVFSTPLSATADENAKAAELITQYCKRLAENGKNAVLIVNGLSALADFAMPLLSSAINAEEGGSLTVIGFVNSEGEYASGNSPELLNAANMRLVISPDFAPAIDVFKSFTLGREYLQSADEIKTAEALRKKAYAEGLNEIINIFGTTASNAEIISDGR